MLRIIFGIALCAGLACSTPPGTKPDGGKSDGGGGGGGSGGDSFNVFVLDSNPSAPKPVALTVHQDQVRVAYFTRGDGGVTLYSDGGYSEFAPNYDLRYVEWQNGQATQPQRITVVQNMVGLAIANQGSGEPAVAYLGGGSDQSLYWLQSDGVVAYRSGGSWTERVAVRLGDEAACGNIVSDRGTLVGLHPGLAFDGAKAYLAYRDAHGGQYPKQDWDGSDLELAEGGPTSWTKRCLMEGGNNKMAYGGFISMAIGAGTPALVHSRVPGTADGNGQDAIFMKRKTDGTWSQQVVLSLGNVQSGTSLAWDSQMGWGIAAVERAENKLMFTSSTDGVLWATPDPVWQAGSGGWYPSLAFDPVHHEPAIAYYNCSPRAGVNETACLPAEDELLVAQRVGPEWRMVVVDKEGGYLPKLGFLSSGKRVVAYRHPATGALKLAVEK